MLSTSGALTRGFRTCHDDNLHASASRFGGTVPPNCDRTSILLMLTLHIAERAQVINSSTKLGPRNFPFGNSEAVFETTRKPGLGPSFTFLTDATLWLSRRTSDPSDGSALHTVEVFRSRVSVSPTFFRMTTGV